MKRADLAPAMTVVYASGNTRSSALRFGGYPCIVLEVGVRKDPNAWPDTELIAGDMVAVAVYRGAEDGWEHDVVPARWLHRPDEWRRQSGRMRADWRFDEAARQTVALEAALR